MKELKHCNKLSQDINISNALLYYKMLRGIMHQGLECICIL